jgi:DNA-directed RNA polymerase specialized sigma subunit
MTSEVKIYEMDGVRFRFMPDGSPLEGALSVEYPEHEPYTAHLSLAKSLARKRYANEAAKRSGIDEEHLTNVLAALCSMRFEEIEAAQEAEAQDTDSQKDLAEVSEEEINALIGKPGVLTRLVKDATTFSKVVGEKYLLGLLFLAFLSAQLELLPNGKPLGANCILSAQPGRGKNYLCDAVARLLPEEFYFTFESSSPKSLFYKAKLEGTACLKHRMLYPNEAEAVDPLIETFRPVLSGGKAKLVTVGKNSRDENVGQEIELEGPMTLVVPTVRNKLDKQLQSRMLLADIEDYQGRVSSHSGAVSEQISPDYAGTDYSQEIFSWQSALRSLTKVRRVVTPMFHEEFRFDSDAVPHGARLWTNFLGLMSAHAWLEQRNRKIITLENGELAIVASSEDYRIAYKIFEETCERSIENLSDTHRRILDGLFELREEECSWGGFSQKKISEKSGVSQSAVSDNKSFLVMSLKWVWEPEGGGLALANDADPSWWEKADALVGFPKPEQVKAWWGEDG